MLALNGVCAHVNVITKKLLLKVTPTTLAQRTPQTQEKYMLTLLLIIYIFKFRSVLALPGNMPT